jgi:hypothetical protein
MRKRITGLLFTETAGCDGVGLNATIRSGGKK